MYFQLKIYDEKKETKQYANKSHRPNKRISLMCNERNVRFCTRPKSTSDIGSAHVCPSHVLSYYYYHMVYENKM